MTAFRKFHPGLLVLLIGAMNSTLALATPDGLEEAIKRFAQIQTQGLPGKVEITVGPLDPRSRLGHCSSYEPFIPAGSRLWGKTNIGVKCVNPSIWTVYIPVGVSVFGHYLKSARPLSAGQAIAGNDIEVVQGDLTALPDTILTDPAQAIGKRPRIGLAAGQPLRADQIVVPPAIRQGQTVKLITRGPGFTVSTEGKALTNAGEGQTVHVRGASGQTISGIARPGGVVEINY